MPLSTQPYKGARDFYPEDMRLQKYLFGLLREVVESYGYEEYNAPILEPSELYQQKGSEEIVNSQTYSFTDRGGRPVTIRTEMTPSVSRMVAARRQELPMPLRWYSIPNLWRYERPQRGRLREFWQLNVDLFGIAGVEADQEVIEVADGIMRRLGATKSMYEIKLNSRKLMDVILHQYLGLNDVQTNTLLRLIDKMHKMDQAAFTASCEAILNRQQRNQAILDKLLAVLRIQNLSNLPAEVKTSPAYISLHNLMESLKDSGVDAVVFDVTVMRGFDYYTDVVFEVFDKHPENNRSLFGGGRYDGLVGLFGVEPVPTVGFGMGDAPVSVFMELHELMPELRTETDVYVVCVGQDTYQKAQRVLKSLREEGVKVACDMTGRKIAAQIKTADKKKIPYILFIGETELSSGQYQLKNIKTGDEQTLSLERAIATILASKN